ncbi:hypothetical protein FRACYDRAFT_246103 [Fragilariopsis cylindrus CCMP1102]|uniref:SGNH hydrolase-type esterase domain-containing protein n=1 Tax=Fragilariopsis cylindrus CCMP1102 TaxID=635003 RepID=A0A1E7EYK6_9STRA|nr:hypothetical protein FRACYDRAFT_246103 [Fragilariopsis cylindrus CCMP1102]|eukprot:OEU11002.1 hypothetical protein FRACYDRAFT_246103 [Fragilariopsis cylindrus CCMP1102]
MAINKNKNTIIKKVFCFGDSLTAGTSPPYERIPPSGWQIQDSNKVGNIANEVNEKLQSWCCCDNDVGGSSSSTASSSSCSTIVTYVPFPIKEFDRDSGVWAPDGLHLSPEGYKTIGVSLSPIIANILNLC